MVTKIWSVVNSSQLDMTYLSETPEEALNAARAIGHIKNGKRVKVEDKTEETLGLNSAFSNSKLKRYIREGYTGSIVWQGGRKDGFYGWVNLEDIERD